MKIPKSPIKKNILANFSSVGVQLFNQIVLVPFYLTLWNVNLYSDWIILTALVSFFSVSDIGLNNVSINRFVIKYSEGNRNECTQLLTNNFVLIFLIALLSIVGSLIYINIVDIVKSLGLHSVSRSEANYIFIILLMKIFLGFLSSIFGGIYNATQNTHKAILITNISILAEVLVIIITLVFHYSVIALVTFYIIPKIILFIYFLLDSQRYFKFSFRIRNYNYKLLKEVMVPSVSFMSFPLGNAIIYQGFSIVINKFFGANSLVLFNTTRTMANFIKTLLSTIQNSVWPEYSIAFGKNDISRMRNIHRKAFIVATSISIALSLFLLTFGNLIYKIWTHGKISFNFELMIAFLIIVFFQSVWGSSSVTLMATNKHSKLGIIYLILSFISISIAFCLSQIWPSLILTTYCMLLIDISISYYAVKSALRLTKDTLSGLFLSYKSFYKTSFKQILN